MNFFRSSLLTAACVALMAVLAASLAGAQTPRIEDIFGPRYLHRVRISPDGQMLAAVASWDSDIQGLVTVEIATGKTRSLRGSAWMGVYSVAWYGNRNLLFSVSADKIFTYGLYTTPSDDLRRQVAIIK